MTGAQIAGVGAAAPDATLSSEELERTLGLEPGWIESRTAIRSRHVAGPSDSAVSLGARAARTALESAGVEAGDVDYLIVATITADYEVPATASVLQSALGCDRAAAFDMNAGCSGFVYALAQADALVRSGAAGTVLIVGADLMSRIVDYSDPKTAVLFGDGAGAAVVTGAPSSSLGPFLLRSDGSRPELLTVARDGGKVIMSGRDVYRRAVQDMTASVRSVMGTAGVTLDDVDLVVAHQANGKIVDAVGDRLGVPPDKLFSNVARYGNTSAASVPIALVEAQAMGRLNEGDLVVLTAFGSGFAWGAAIVHWTAARPAAQLARVGAARV